ncbi:MAG: shikimate dehydrogenase [Rhodospirillaceae bacterium]|nr:shikimate dehydrogenase [Rhodospirillaceae bacterium]
MPVDGATRLYAIIGCPIAQARSPAVFNRLFGRLGVPAVLVPVEIAPADLAIGLAGLTAIANLDGIIVTVPHKPRMAALADAVAPMGQRVGAVNALRRRPQGGWLADMFDGRGFVAGLAGRGHAVAGRSALLVGAGGAGSAIAFALAEAGIARLHIRDIAPERAVALARRVADACPHLRPTAGPQAEPADIAINATPLGMAAEDPLPLDVQALAPGTLVVDVIMKPARTRLLAQAEARGLPTHAGRHMLDAQVDAIAGFFGLLPPRS